MLCLDGFGATALTDDVLLLRQGLQEDLHPGCVGAALLGLRVEPGSELIGEVRLSRGGGNGLVWVWDGHKKLASIASQSLPCLDNPKSRTRKRVPEVLFSATISLFPTSPKSDILHPDDLSANPTG